MRASTSIFTISDHVQHTVLTLATNGDGTYPYYRESVTGNIVALDLSAGEGCFGVTLQTGIDYKISKNVSIGFKINGLIMSMEKPEGYNIDKYDFYGIKRIDALCGISIYL